MELIWIEIRVKNSKNILLDEMELIWIEIRVKNSKNILLCIMYKPPDSSTHLTKIFTNSLRNMLSVATKEKKELILLGDLNVNYLSNADHKEIKELFLLYGLSQVIKSATRYDLHHQTSSLIDVILVKNASSIARSEVIPMSIGDHDTIGSVFKINTAKFSARKIQCRDYRHYNPQEMCNDIRNSDLHKIRDITSVNDAWRIFRDTLVTIFRLHLLKNELKGNLALG